MWLLTVLGRGTKSLRPRKDKRFIAETLTSPMGRVKDVSSSGVCIVGANRTRDLIRGKVTPIYLDTPHGRLSFIARVVWVRKTREGHEAGLSLLDVKPHVARLLRQLGELGFVPSNGDTQEPVAPSIPPELCNALGIAPDATDDEIMRAYRQTAMAYRRVDQPGFRSTGSAHSSSTNPSAPAHARSAPAGSRSASSSPARRS